MKSFLIVSFFVGLLAWPTWARAADFELKDGDRVVLLGNTLIEREQRYGFWETALTRRYPNSNIIFRNLGWSGDTVFGEARASFGTQADGFRLLKEEVFALDPTVILVGYGSNESFAGEAGLAHFLQGLNTLLEVLAQTKARIVLMSPLPQEDKGRPWPDPATHNNDIRLYRDALRKVADQRGFPFVDLYGLVLGEIQTSKPALLTDNGIHLTGYGYWKTAAVLEAGLGLKPSTWTIDVDMEGKATVAEGVSVSTPQGPSTRFQVTDAILPSSLPPADGPARDVIPGTTRILRIHGLAPGSYALHIDGKQVAKASTEEWAKGVQVAQGPDFEQAEKLRIAVVEKNRLFFHRWRPENETYLFGFRKNEQGKNGKEIPEFDPLVAEMEKEIARLRRPVAHQYEILPEGGGK